MATVIKGKVVASDLNVYDGTNETVNRKDHTGGTLSSLPINHFVDVLQAYGRGTSYTRSTIQDAVNAIGTRTRTILFRPGTWVIDDDLTIPSNITSYVPAGVVFSVSSGKTLTFSGPVIRDSDTWTSGSGTVTANLFYPQLASTSDTALGDALVGYKNPETGGGARTVHAHLVDRPVLATDFQLNADGSTDDSTPLTNTIAAAIANDSRKVIVPAGVIALATKLSITSRDVQIIAAGADWNHDFGSIASLTEFKWTGAAGGTMMEISAVSGATEQAIGGCSLVGIGFNANNLAAKGLSLLSHKGGRFKNLLFHGFSTVCLELDVVATLGSGEPRDSQHNRFENIVFRQYGFAGDCLWLDGDGTANASFNSFMDLVVLYQDGKGLVFKDADNNFFHTIQGYRAAGGAGIGIEFQGGASTPQTARANHLYHVSPGAGGVTARGTPSYTAASYDNNIHAYDIANGPPLPTIETGATLWWHTDGNVSHNLAVVGLGLGDNDTGSKHARDNLGTASLRVKNDSSNHVILDDGTGTWGIQLDGSGGLRFVRLSGAGAIAIPDPATWAGKTITEGPADSGGVGFKVLRVPN